MGLAMVGTIANESTTSYQVNQAQPSTYETPTHKSSSVDTSHAEPDLLVKKYFLASPQIRAKIRSALVKNFKSVNSMLAILIFSANPNIDDAYAGSIDLIAECENFQLLAKTVATLLSLTQAPARSQNQTQLTLQETYWEILIRGMGCAYRLPAEDRLQLLRYLLSDSTEILNRRAVRAAILDSLVILADEEGIDKEEIKPYIRLFMQPSEHDQYIRTFAEAALEDLA
jgi:hypothetical protein